MTAPAVSDGVTAFLAARLDEDEAAAEAARDAHRWRGASKGDPHWDTDSSGVSTADGVRVASGPYAGSDLDEETGGHIARHDPARVLRSVTADRELLEAYASQDGYDLPESVHDGRDPDERERDEDLQDTLAWVIRVRAAVYSDHPGYQNEWAP